MAINDVLSPFRGWKHLFNDPVSLKDPINREAADRYRGFHQNDIQDCIGCGTCEEICQNGAIDMLPLAGVETVEGDSGLRPRIDYGRCCWCALCVDVCTTGYEGDPIAIRWLKRHITDQVPRERYGEIVGKAGPATGKSVAIIGAGPAGLTAAFDLAKAGHKVVVFESRKHPGGMLRYGIPEYRLPYDVIEHEISVIAGLGVDIRCDTRVGTDVMMDDLKDDHDAVLLTIGLHLGRSTRIPGSEAKSVTKAVDMLREITNGDEIRVPKKAVVIGGGNVAMDIARSLARLQKKKHGKVDMRVTALESLEHFLADPDEIKECLEEGIKILDARGPQEVMLNRGRVTGLRTWAVDSIFDAKGRFAPHYNEDDEVIHAADMVIEAIGQMADVSLLGHDLTEALEWNRGRLAIDAEGRTSAPWLWAGGDAVSGPDVVHAVADGHAMARSIESAFTTQEQKNAT